MNQVNIRLVNAVVLSAIFVMAAGTAIAQSAKKASTYRIVGAGDIMAGSDYPNKILYSAMKPGASPTKLLGPGLARVFQGGPNKVVFGNFEGTIHSLKGPAKYCRNPRYCYVFRSPPFYAKIFRRIGFNLGSLANNHAGDFLAGGRAATFRTLTRAGIKVAGLDTKGMRTTVLTLADGTRVGLAAFAPNPGTLSIHKIARAQRIVRGLAKRSDLVVVSFHGGAEGSRATRVRRKTEIFLGENRGNVWKFSHSVIDAGADVVIGHGPHVPRAVEVYRRRFIAYSLGNFWTYGRFNIRGISGIAPVMDIRVDRKGQVVSARIRSIKLIGRGVPRLDKNQAALKTVRRLTKLDFPEKRLKFHSDGRITGPGIGRR